MRNFPRFTLLFLAFCAASSACAQDVTLGAGLAWAPRYPGAEDNCLRAIPLVGVSYGRFFAGGDPDGGGAEGPSVGVSLLDLAARYRASDKLTLSAGPGITWADDDYMQTFFGVTPGQAAASALPAYEARGGAHMVRAGDAEGSPITRDRDQHLTALFASYRF
jgi:outer membrane scaffolding protein for murein synthesis (MipA/OmpV family)